MSGYHHVGPHGAGGTSPSDDRQNPFAHPHDDARRQYGSPSPTMSPMRPPVGARSPSPRQPLNPQSYQMEPLNHANSRPLDIPMGPGPGRSHSPSDRLPTQPSYSVDHVNDPYAYHSDNQYNDPYQAHHDDYHVDPNAHHDAYYNQPYEPEHGHTPGSEMDPHYPPTEQPTHYWQDEHDTRPMLQPDTSYGPDPYQTQPSPVQEKPMEGGEYMTADGRPAPTPSPAPVKRWKTVKEIQLFRGNLVLDCPIPPRLLNQVPHVAPPERDEFTHMRYSAATCDPNDFFSEGFTLRQNLFAKPRHTELFIVITMYNEEEELFARTMIGVIQNIEYMNSRTNSKTWGKEAWKKIVVCIVSDGRAKINARTRAVIASLGCYQEGIAKQQVNGKDVTAHIYEYTTQMALEIKKGVVQVKKGNTPVQLLFCLKEKNQKKINSHRWFFQAFGSVLEPNICVLIDAGTKPGKHSIYQLWKAFDVEPMCAGACGEIKAMLEHGKKLLNPLVAAQNFEYKISNILDKPLESVFGFISVLPGAFSAYRYIALQNDKTGQGPLEKYFKGEKMHGADAGIFTANMYLAEDRILCFELVAKRNCHWILQYVKSAEGETDVPTEMADFIMQRRRWLNGSFFAAVYALVHFYQIFRSKHSCIRKMFFLVEFVYQTINQLFAWFAIGNFFLVFRILTTALAASNMLGTAGRILAVVFEWLYLVTLVTCFVLALGNRPQGSNRFYMTMVYFWCILMVYLLFAAIFVIVKSVQEQVEAHNGFSVGLLFTDQYFRSLVVSLAATYVLYLGMSILFLDPWHMFTSFIQYLLLTPTYTNILNVYAFCNTHDVTWGTKGDDKPPKLGSANIKPGGGVDVAIPDTEHDLNTQYEAELYAFSKKYEPPKKVASPSEKQEDYYKGFRSAVVLVWMFCNLALCAVVLNTGGFDRLEATDSNGDDASTRAQQNSVIYMTVVLWSVAALAAFRFVGSFWFLVIRVIRGV